ncbi:unnamed protein product, partial [Pneumocystis jirovecii]
MTSISLTDALDDLIRDGQIPPQLAMKILLNFDKSITDNLTEKVKSRMTFRGHLDTYRFCDEVWTFIIKNPCFRLENDTMVADKIKIVACNSKTCFYTMVFHSIVTQAFRDRLYLIFAHMGKTCLISGGSRGIGLGIAQRFAKEGNRCILVSKNKDRLKEALSTLPFQNIHEYYSLDVKDPDEWIQLAKKIDKLDVLVNAAGKVFSFALWVLKCQGISQHMLFPRMPMDEIANIVSTNLLGSIYACRVFLRHFLNNKGGSIINISSSIILGGGVGATVYAASKAGISGFTKALSAEWASKGIRVNAISPGYVDTFMLSQLNEKKRKVAESSNHIKRFGNIEEIASAAVFLVCNEFITGTTLYIDGEIVSDSRYDKSDFLFKSEIFFSLSSSNM